MRWLLMLLAWSALAQNSREALQASVAKQLVSVAVQREVAKAR